MNYNLSILLMKTLSIKHHRKKTIIEKGGEFE